jgi:hypothetical protein
MHSNYAVLDKYLDIVSGTPEFFGFVGATAHSSIYSLLDSGYYHIVREAHTEVLENRVEKRIFIRLSNSYNEQKDCYVVLKPYEDAVEEYVYFEIYEMDSTLEKYNALIRHTSVLHSVSLLRQVILFEYAFKYDDLYIYVCNEGNVYKLYRGSLDGFNNKSIENGTIAKHRGTA